MSTARQDYERWHRARAQAEAAVPEGEAQLAPWHELVLAHLDLPPGQNVLEIAAGRGQFAAHLQGIGLAITAADFSLEALKEARRRGVLRTVAADALRLPFPDGCFDAVVSCETIEHLPDWRAGLGEMVRVIRPAGRLYLTFPSYFNAYGLYRAYLRLRGRRYRSSVEEQPIENLLFSGAVHRLLRRLGMKIGCWDAVGHYVFIPKVYLPSTRQLWIERRTLLRKLLRRAGLNQMLAASKEAASFQDNKDWRTARL